MDAVPLNHFYVTVDADTYKAIESSSFLREEFAPFEQRTTVRKDMTYTGSYFYGVHTYFEFFEVGRSLGRVPGASAIAFGVEVPGASPLLRERLEAALKTPFRVDPITRRTGDRDVDWFYMTTTGDRAAPALLQSWVMEYRGGYLAEWYPELRPATRGITRAEILERYAAKIGEAERRQQKLLEDVVEVTLALPAAESSRFATECEALGYREGTDGNTGGDTVTWAGFGSTFHLVPATEKARGIIAVRFSLRREKQGERQYRFGNSVLRFNDDRSAVWTF